MTAYPPHSTLQDLPSDRPDEARLALRRAVQATLAGFAEIDHLLESAERLISQKCADPTAACALERCIDPAC